MAARSNARIALGAAAAVVLMLGMVAASVPLYRMICAATGIGGTPRTAQAAPRAVSDRIVTVRFDASVAKGVPWRFKPVQREIQAHLGEEVLAIFTATNLSRQAVEGTATFNVTPDKVGRYFNKIECFCFTRQRLEPGQSVDMPVTFFVDPGLAADQYANEVTTITLSYTFFRAPEGNERGAEATFPRPDSRQGPS